MARVALAWVASLAVGCFADYASREVQYVPGTKGVIVKPHASGGVGRRLTGDKILMVANPEEIYILQNETAVIVYGTEIRMSEYLWSPGLDLDVSGAVIYLLPEMKFKSPTEGHRRVHIRAELVVASESGSTISVSGDDGEDAPVFKAAMGVSKGDMGANGTAGGHGRDGGELLIEANSIAGVLSVHANGGRGGHGQDGGDGRRGAMGAAAASDACCQKDGSTRGGDGLPGGAGGSGGASGNGGHAGSIVVTYSDDGAITQEANISMQVVGGAAGAKGQPGAGGLGGPGHAGGSTVCTRVSFWSNDWRCFGELGETGSPGAVGTIGPEGQDGSIGASGTTLLDKVAVEDLRSGRCGPYLFYEYHFANTLYAQGNPERARSVYTWLKAVQNKTSSGCLDVEPTPWQEYVWDASLRLQQIATDLDFWGRSPSSAPIQTFDVLMKSATSIAASARESEEVYDAYFATAVSTKIKASLFKRVLNNMDYDISKSKQKVNDLLSEINRVREDIMVYHDILASEEHTFLKDTQECDAAVTKKSADESYGIWNNLQYFVTFAQNIYVKTFALANAALALGGAAATIWNSGEAVVGQLLGGVATLESSQNWNDVYTSLKVTGVATLGLVTSLVSQTQVIAGSSQTLLQDANGTIRGLQEEWSRKSVLDSKVQGRMTQTDYDAFVSGWFADLPECHDVKHQVAKVNNISLHYNQKRAQHDSLAIHLADTVISIKTMSEDRKQYQKTRAGEIDFGASRNMNVVTQAYRSQKRNLITMFKQLRESMNMEFCEAEPFDYQETKVVQMQAFLAQISAERRTKLAAQTGDRALLANFPTSEEAAAGRRVTAAIVIPIRADDSANAAAFQDWQGLQASTLNFFLDPDDALLPSGVSNLRLVDAQVFAPGLMDASVSGDIAKVWLKKSGVSSCNGASGERREFSHKPRTFFSMCSSGDTAVPPKWLTAPADPTGTLSPSPVGLWSMSFPALTTQPQRELITEVSLYLVLSYVPCAAAECGQRTWRGLSEDQASPDDANSAAAGAVTAVAASGIDLVVMFGTLAAVFTLLSAAGFHRVKRGRRTLESPQQVELSNI